MIRKLLTILFEILDAIRGGLSRLPVSRPIEEIVQRRKFDTRNYVIFCLFDTKPRPDLCALFKRLADAGFCLVGVSPNAAADQYDGLLDVVVRISPAGRDFFAYQQGLHALDQLAIRQDAASICFFNDSVWYFKTHQDATIRALKKGLAEEKLVSGTMIFDEIPHCSGWMFAVPCNPHTHCELDKLFAPNFARKSRTYNIRKGEHRILGTFQSVSGLLTLDNNTSSRPYPYCYEALTEGWTCFYMKGDSTLRTNPAKVNLENFLENNCENDELLSALRWISMTSDIILKSWIRTSEAREYQQRYFS
jgi:hypothetical protein